eukprot:TRINITY_DN4839_c0_g1_i1.p1 TRINITY_DN4839_c0_g1~~TRINITY_DN4839_c0_g1_i1.p1  ORF type:complete len:521 (-),score=101.10 TRINITY_DN4839_c0_g1_i1:117-1640(-)
MDGVKISYSRLFSAASFDNLAIAKSDSDTLPAFDPLIARSQTTLAISEKTLGAVEAKGELVLTVLEAKGLPRKLNYLLKIAYGEKTTKKPLQEFETKVVFQKRSPKWNENYFFETDTLDTKHVEFSLYSWKLFGTGDLIAKAYAPLNVLIKRNQVKLCSLPLVDANTNEPIEGASLLVKVLFSSFQRNQAYIDVVLKNSSSLLKILFEENFIFARSLIYVAKEVELAKILIRIFHDHGKAVKLLRFLIQDEIEPLSETGTPFRIDSGAKTCFTEFFWLAAPNYLPKTIDTCLIQIKNNMESTTSDEPTIDELKAAVSLLINSISESLPLIPFEIRKLLRFLREFSSKKHPNSDGLSGVINLMILRHIVPYITVRQEKIPRLSKLYLAVSQILMKICTKKTFSAEGSVNSQLNGVITVKEFRDKIFTFIERLSTMPTEKEVDVGLQPRPPPIADDLVKQLSVVVLFAYPSLEKIKDKFRSFRPTEAQTNELHQVEEMLWPLSQQQINS